MTAPAIHTAIAWAVGAIAVGAMELWAGLLHLRVWHGPLWRIHRSHHAPRSGRFERNDALSTLHAPLAMVLIVTGCRLPPGVGHDVALGAGAGMTVFGTIYLVLHDGLVHRRIPVGFLRRLPLLDAIAAAHAQHHRRGGGPPYGLLFGPWELRRALRRRRASTEPPRAPIVPRPTARERRERGATRPDGASRSAGETE